MSRAKEFRREDVLREAIPVFAQGGYAGTSTSTLLNAMGISRQSMYDTFGGKRSLYLAALRQHLQQVTQQRLSILNADEAPLARLASLLQQVVSQAANAEAAALLEIGSVCEFGCSDREIVATLDAAHDTLLNAVVRCLEQARAAGQVDERLDTDEAARFLSANMTAIELAARGGASLAILQGIATLAMRTLTHTSFSFTEHDE